MIELESREVSFHRHFSPGPSNQNLAGSLSCNTYNKKFHQSEKLTSGEIHTHTRYKTLYNKSSLKNTVFWNHVSFWGGSMFIELPNQWILFLQTCHKVMNCLTSHKMMSLGTSKNLVIHEYWTTHKPLLSPSCSAPISLPHRCMSLTSSQGWG